MGNEWQKCVLGDIVNIKHGYAFKGEYITTTPTESILVTPGNFAIGGGFQIKGLKYYNGLVPVEYVLRPGQLVVTMTDLSKESDTLGYSAIIPEDGKTWLHNQRIGLVEIKEPSLVDTKFINYLLRTREYRSWVVGSASGTTVKHTSPGRICEYSFMLPSLREQEAIACILGALDDKIELNRQMCKTLEETAQAIFKSWFVDFDPVHAKAAGKQPEGLKPEIAALFPDSFEDSELGKIPKGWRVTGLDSLGTFLNGLALQKYPPLNDDSLPVVKIAQLRTNDTTNSDRASASIGIEYIVNDGDILFSWSGSLECVIWFGGAGALNQHLFKVTSDKYSKWFLYMWIHRHLPEFRHIAAGKATTMGHIQRHHLKDAKVLVPPTDLLFNQDKIMEPLIDVIISRALENRKLAVLRDTLLPKLISGEIRVKDAKRIAVRSV